MIEVLRTNDPVRLSYAVAVLTDAGCHPFVADRFMASAEGGISAFQRRILVPDEFSDQARAALKALDDVEPLPEDGDYGAPEGDTP